MILSLPRPWSNIKSNNLMKEGDDKSIFVDKAAINKKKDALTVVLF